MINNKFTRVLLTILAFWTNYSFSNCDLELSENTVSWDEQTRGDILESNQYSKKSLIKLGGERVIDINVQCKNPQEISLKFNSQIFDEGSYRFGKDGKMTVSLHNVRVDGIPVDIVDTEVNNIGSSSMLFKPGHKLSFLRNGVSINGLSLNAQVIINTYVTQDMTRVTDILNISNEGLFTVN